MNIAVVHLNIDRERNRSIIGFVLGIIGPSMYILAGNRTIAY